jgi:hypothetical protein
MRQARQHGRARKPDALHEKHERDGEDHQSAEERLGSARARQQRADRGGEHEAKQKGVWHKAQNAPQMPDHVKGFVGSMFLVDLGAGRLRVICLT